MVGGRIWRIARLSGKSPSAALFLNFCSSRIKKHALWLATNILSPCILRVKESQNKMTKSCCNINNISHGSGLSMSLMH